MSNSLPRSPMPDLDLIVIARTTRKTLDRLASFSKMRSTSKEPLPLLEKISRTILTLIRLIDSSMLAAQIGYQLTSDAMIMCDPEETDWEADVSTDGLRGISKEGYETAKSVMEGFRDVKQEVYKIAASTKDNNTVVLVPPDPFHVDTMKIHLKDIGTDLVANLNLLSEFSRETTDVSGWWSYVKEDLADEHPTLLPSSFPSGMDDGGQTRSDAVEKFAKWFQLKEGFQQYYNIINAAQARYPDLLPLSSAAWKSVASPRSVEASSVGHSASQGFLGDSSPASRPQMPADRHAKHKFFDMFDLKQRSRRALRRQTSEPVIQEKVNDPAQDQGKNGIVRQGTRGSSNTATSRSSSPLEGNVSSSIWCCSATVFLESMGNYGHSGFFL